MSDDINSDSMSELGNKFRQFKQQQIEITLGENYVPSTKWVSVHWTDEPWLKTKLRVGIGSSGVVITSYATVTSDQEVQLQIVFDEDTGDTP